MTGEVSSVFKEAFEEAAETADPWQLAIVNKKEHIDRPGWFTKNTD